MSPSVYSIMAYYGRRNFRRRNGRRRKYNRSGSSVQKYMSAGAQSLWLARKAWTATKYLKGLVNSELKYLDLEASINPPQPATGPAPIQLSAIPQGDTSITRDGNSVLLKSVSVKFYTVINASAVDTQVRCVIFKWDDSTTPTWTDLFVSTNLMASRNRDQSKKYKILYDKIHIMDDQTPSRVFNSYIPLQVHAKYSGSAATTYTSGNILMFICSDQSPNTPALNYVSRVNFYDN